MKEMLSMPFSLDESTLKEAEEAASKFVNGPWRCGPVRKPENGSKNKIAQPTGVVENSSLDNSAPFVKQSDEPADTPEVEEASSVPPSAPEAETKASGPSEAPVVTGSSPVAETPAAAASASPVDKTTGSSSPSATPPKSAEKPMTEAEAQLAALKAKKTWANIVSKDDEAVLTASRSSASKEDGKESKAPKNTIVDCLLWHAKTAAEADSTTEPPEPPDEFKEFKRFETGINNLSKAKYQRRGMRNDAGGNSCYVNVVVQSLLPCSALMQLLSHCAPNDQDRPFYTGMVRLCREFHGKSHNDPCNVLAMPQVMEIISRWRSIGAQQDAGEFLFYMLNGMHEECKWKSSSSSAGKVASAASADGDDAEEGGAAEVQLAGVHEESPIARIFGGLMRSSVRSKSSKADSVSLEPFNHLILDISSPTVDSVWTALEAYCGAEAVNEGAATKRLQFQTLPKVLILNLKRFSYNKEAGRPKKVAKDVKYDETLVFDKDWLVDGLESPEYQ
eukprot:CAMPEP_0197678862 /NCGR_PEP_ID=MMETSP1338-20131121/90730_1 /TAXON_ID=43686 ORGANISM="Pelagodinium beii, Strain RCC1491" /NCGR_SAMPLE_ID=MMETSP1338 /ASSEMBLY_ACC=CAM_ASM_000754 /LENGTH=504 /DNA_ID=CAMNT_0043259847 /DNA_START=36 /DNA_END=1547 /DNA_ORIENTATION=+